MVSNIAVRAREISRSLAPGAGIRLLAGNVRGNGAAGKLPHADARITPLHGHDATAVLVVRRSKGVGRSLDATAGVAVLGRVAVLVERLVGLFARDAHGAAGRGVQRHLVSVVGLVGGLHDVDFAVLGPVGRVGEPQRRPGAAAGGSVADVKDEEAVVVGVFGLYAHREAASGGVGDAVGTDRGVDFEDRGILRCKGQVLFINVGDIRQGCRVEWLLTSCLAVPSGT